MYKLLKSEWTEESGEPFPLLQDLMAYNQGMQMNFEIIYFNKKTFSQEPLIEPYSMVFSCGQEMPLSQMETCMTSPDMLDINLTYGCIISL